MEYPNYGMQNYGKDSQYGLSTPEKIQALTYLTSTEAEKIKEIEIDDSDEDLSLRVFTSGQSWDLLDKVNKWCEAEVVEVKENVVKFHYVGWSERWDEWVPRGSQRVAKAGKRTRRRRGRAELVVELVLVLVGVD